MTSALITPEALEKILWNGHVKPVDASWFVGEPQRGRRDYLQRRIPRAVFFDLEDISDHASAYPHMLPTPQEFQARVGRLGISSHDKIVAYDSEGLFSAARVWWMFRVFGHDKVQVLDGGLPRWAAEGRKVVAGDEEVIATRFTAKLSPGLYRCGEDVFNNLERKTEQLLDARSPARFKGEEPEPRPGLKSGHIPGAVNIYYKDLIAEGRLKSPDALREIMAASGIDLAKPIVTMCGSGVTACILALAFYELGKKDVSVYDGSWAEWGAMDGLPVEAAPTAVAA